MDKRNLIVGGLTVFVARQVLQYLTHAENGLLGGFYADTAELWRMPDDMQSMMWIMMLVGLLWSAIFVCIYGWFQKGSGVLEGLKYGFVIGLFVTVPMAFNSYVVMPVPMSLALGWFACGMVEVMILGALLALVYKPR